MGYWKATRPDGTDFRTGTVDYGAALVSGAEVSHPNVTDRRRRGHDPARYLSVATVPTDCTGMSWPCRLFEVEPVGAVWTPGAASLPNKRACYSLRVVRELPAHEALGPQGAQLVSLIGQAAALTEPQVRELAAAWDAAWDAARAAAWDAAWDAARAAAWDAARAAAGALLVRDLIGTRDGWDQAAYDLLTGPWASVVGKVHPDD